MKPIYAHIDFIPRLYVQATSARIEFGVRRAFLSLEHENLYSILRNESWLNNTGRQSAYYIINKRYPYAVNICIDPVEGRSALKELALPPAPGENRFSKIAFAEKEVQFSEISAKISFSLTAESLIVFSSEDQDKPAPDILKKISAIMSIIISKESDHADGWIEKAIPVKERRQ